MREVARKLKFKAQGVVINAPADLEKEFVSMGYLASLNEQAKSVNTLVFILNFQEFSNFLKTQSTVIEPDSILWIAYPKGSSGVKTDINRDILRAAAPEYGITTVAAISINDTWSALRFRPTESVGK